MRPAMTSEVRAAYHVPHMHFHTTSSAISTAHPTRTFRILPMSISPTFDVDRPASAELTPSSCRRVSCADTSAFMDVGDADLDDLILEAMVDRIASSGVSPPD